MVCILLGSGFEEIEVIAPCDILRRGGVDVRLVGVESTEVTGGHGITLHSDMLLRDLDPNDIDMLVVPGGLGGVVAIEKSPASMELVRRAYEKGAEIAAICAGPRVLGALGILLNHAAVCYPGMEDEMNCPDMRSGEKVVRDKRVTTGCGPGAAVDFGLKLLEVIKGKEAARNVAAGMVYNV